MANKPLTTPSKFRTPATASASAKSSSTVLSDVSTETRKLVPLPEVERKDPSKDEIPEVAAYFKKKRWHFYWERMFDGKHVVALDVRPDEFQGPISAEDYKMIAKSKTVRQLDFRKVNTTNEGLKILAEMSNLEDLLFQGDDVTDDGLRELARLPKLERLFIGSFKITGAGFDAFAKSKSLKALQLHHMSELNDEGAEHLGRIANLEVLTIQLFNNSNLTKRGVQAMIATRIPSVFQIDRSLLDDELFRTLVPKGLLYGPKNPIAVRYGEQIDWPTSALELRNVLLEQGHVTSKGLAALRDCKNVRYMWLRAEPDPDAILKEAANFKSLETLSLKSRDREIQVGGEGIDAIAALSLKELQLEGVELSQDTMKAIGKLSKLEHLELRDTKFKTESIKNFTGLSKLRKLVVYQSTFDDTVAKAIPVLPVLEEVELVGIEIGESGLNSLLKQPKLKAVELWRTGVDKAVIERARRAHPGVSIKTVD